MQTNLLERFHRIEALLHRLHQQNHRDHGPMGDPHRGQGRVLALLKLQPEINQKDLLYLLDMKPQSLGELLAKLERSGFITRTPSETDRRAMQIKLTEAGAKAAETPYPYKMENLFDCLCVEEQEILCGYLDRIIVVLEQQIRDEFERRPVGGPLIPPPPHHEHHRFGPPPPHREKFPPYPNERWERPEPKPPVAPKGEEEVPPHLKDEASGERPEPKPPVAPKGEEEVPPHLEDEASGEGLEPKLPVAPRGEKEVLIQIEEEETRERIE